MSRVPPQHTFLFEEARWSVRGFSRDEHGAERPCTGRTEVVHERDRWLVDTALTIDARPPSTLASRYEVQPPSVDDPGLRFVMRNPMLGELRGTFALAGDTLLSHADDGGTVHSLEALRLTRTGYDVRGALLVAGRVVSSWTLSMERTARSAPEKG
jgi:hypothetical protein